MTSRRIVLVLGGCATLAAATIAGVALTMRGRTPRTNRLDCAQMCLIRCCEILGVPLRMAEVADLLPPQGDSHSLLQIADAFTAIGLKAEGRHDDIDGLRQSRFPAVAHLRAPGHFVVVLGVDAHRVQLLDGMGHRTSWSVSKFSARWSGMSLFVARDPAAGPLAAFGRGTPHTGPIIRFDTLFLDKGTIVAGNGVAVFEFPFQNVGSEPLVVTEVHTSCKCVKSQKPDSPVPPDGRGVVTLRYRIGSPKGPFQQAAAVETNDPRAAVVKLTAAGNTATDVTVYPERLDLGEVAAGNRKTAACYVTYDGDPGDFAILAAELPLRGASVASYPIGDLRRSGKWLPGAKGNITTSEQTFVVEVALAPSVESAGKVSGVLAVHTNIEGNKLVSVPVTAEVVSPLACYPHVLSFGEASAGETVRRTVRIESRTRTPFRVLAARALCPGLKCLFPPGWIDTGAEIEFRLDGGTASNVSGATVKLEAEERGTGRKLAINLPVRVWNRTVQKK